MSIEITLMGVLRILLGTALAKNGKQGRHLKNSRQI